MNIIVKTREEAVAVLDCMSDILVSHPVVSIGDVKTLVGLPTTYVDEQSGWKTMDGISTVVGENEVVVVLPPAEPIQ